MVEFALVLPLLLLVVFTIIELARLLHAWVAIENGARFAVRYAVTGEYNSAYCDMFPDDECDELSEEDAARIPSIKDAALSGSASIWRNDGASIGQPGYFKVTVCSNKSGMVYFPSDPDTSTPAECTPIEDAGGPGDRVSVTVDFDHPLILPLISEWWPQVHLSARREGIVEQFKVARVVGLPATIAVPTFTATITNTPTITQTPTETSTPTPTPCKVPPVVTIVEPIEGATYTTELGSQAQAYDPDNVDPDTCSGVGDDGEGINKVEFLIDHWNGSGWERVHSHTEGQVAYCGFGGNSPCQIHDFLEDFEWPNGTEIEDGLHRMMVRALDDDNVYSEWAEVQFYIELPPMCEAPPVVDIVNPVDGGTYSTQLPAQAQAYDPDTVDPFDCEAVGIDGEGINKVQFQIDYWNGSGWDQVHSQTESVVSYCGFGGNSPCQVHDFSGDYRWPNGTEVNNGTHRMRARAQDDDGVYSDWTEVQFTISILPTPTPTMTPTPDCSALQVKKIWIDGDDLRVRVRNNNPVSVHLTDSYLIWPELSSSMRVNFFQYDWDTYYSGDDYDSPTSAGPSNPQNFAHPPDTNQVWRADFNGVPDGLLYGDFSVTLMYDDRCQLNASLSEAEPTPTMTPTVTYTPSITPSPTRTPTPSCSLIYASNVRKDGDDFEVRVRNNNPMTANLTYSSLSWNTSEAPPMEFNFFKFQGNTYYTPNSYDSPVSSSAPSIGLASGENKYWEADFNLNGAPMYGYYEANLTFEFPGWGTCQVSGAMDIPEPTNTPTPTDTPPATNTPRPTDTPTPGPTATATDSITDTPEPTNTLPPMDG